ncbi:cupin domain-containing protein [Pseudomonas sp. CF161]|uniref:cupin domain-containing protein n=1 Tax=Pseudomonas sp. CF161 TaxID=911241 RepID=UPI0005B7EABD|nr:cupin domain-containing protein [Pseudomonas sp. CF161]
MKVQKLTSPTQMSGLLHWGEVGLPDSPVVSVSGTKVEIGGESVDTGVFECTPGSYRRSVKEAEVMHFLQGAGSFTPDGEKALEFGVGDTFFFEANTQGTWIISDVMRKLYVILK